MADTEPYKAEFEAWARVECNLPFYAAIDWNHAWTKQAWKIWQASALASRPAEVDERSPRHMLTAPHDGTEVLAWSITGKTWHQVYWKTQEHGDWLWEKPFPPRWACRWNSDYHQGQNEFSHWLPIPGAPSHTTNKEK